MNTRENVIVGLNDSIEILDSLAQEGGRYTAIEEEELLESVQAFLQDAIGFVKEIDVTPEELERLKKCRHECKIDCLLKEYERVKADRDALLESLKPRLLTPEDFYNRSDCDGALPAWLEFRNHEMHSHYVVTTLEEINNWDQSYSRFWTSRPTDGQREAEPWN